MRPNQKSNKEIWKLRKKIKLKSENFYSRLGFNSQKVRNVWTCNLRLFFLKSFFFFSSRVLLFISLMVMNLASQCWACNILSNPNNASCDFLFWMKHNLQLSLNGHVILFCFVLFIFFLLEEWDLNLIEPTISNEWSEKKYIELWRRNDDILTKKLNGHMLTLKQ